MRLTHWFVLLAALVGLSALQATHRTLLVLKGYAVEERLEQLHAREVALARLDTRLAELRSPARLAEIAREQQLKLVAWSRLDAVRAPDPGTAGAAAGKPAQLAAATDDTSD